MSKPFAGYVRVSDTRGRAGTDSFISPDLQKREILHWAERKGFAIRMPWVEDMDKSGGTMERPGFQSIMEMIESGEVSGIVCAKLDRYSRTLVGALKEFERAAEAGGEIVLLDQDVDSTDPDSMFTFQLRLSMAERERKLRRLGFYEANQRAVADGVHICTVAPTGYAKPGKRQPLEIDLTSGPLISRAFTMRAGGSTKGDIAAFLNEHGCENEKGPILWRPATMHNLFSNRAYLGEAYYGDLSNPDAHPALVDRMTWQAAQAAPRLDKMRKESPHVLRGFVWCAGCSRLLTPDTRKTGPRASRERKPVYICRGIHSDGICDQRPSTDADQLEPLVEARFWEIAKGRVMIPSADDSELSLAEVAAERATAERIAFQESESLVDLGNAYSEGLISRINKEDEAQAKVGEIRARGEDADLGDVQELQRLWPELLTAEKRKLISTVIGAVVVRKGTEPLEDRVLVFARGTEPIGDLATRTNRIPVAAFSLY